MMKFQTSNYPRGNGQVPGKFVPPTCLGYRFERRTLTPPPRNLYEPYTILLRSRPAPRSSRLHGEKSEKENVPLAAATAACSHHCGVAAARVKPLADYDPFLLSINCNSDVTPSKFQASSGRSTLHSGENVVGPRVPGEKQTNGDYAGNPPIKKPV
jgi:hypothetical protein